MLDRARLPRSADNAPSVASSRLRLSGLTTVKQINEGLPDDANGFCGAHPTDIDGHRGQREERPSGRVLSRDELIELPSADWLPMDHLFWRSRDHERRRADGADVPHELVEGLRPGSDVNDCPALRPIRLLKRRQARLNLDPAELPPSKFDIEINDQHVGTRCP